MRRQMFLCMFIGMGITLPVFSDEIDVKNGKVLYEAYCTQCHGISGDGKGINIPDMSVLPRDHTDTSEMSARTDEELTKAIKHGGKSVNKSVLMPAWEGNLNDRQIADLVAYLRELCCAK